MWLDPGTGIDIVQWPVEEVESLRQEHVTHAQSDLKAGELKEIANLRGSQVGGELMNDWQTSFEIIAETARACEGLQLLQPHSFVMDIQPSSTNLPACGVAAGH